MVLPMLSARGRQSWGVGEIGDLVAVCDWLRDADIGFLQLLPLNEMRPGENSPFSALSSMAIDPLYISLRHNLEFKALGGEEALDPAAKQQLSAVRACRHIDYNAARSLKTNTLHAAFERFRARDWAWKTPRAVALQEYCIRESWWLSDHALFHALRDRHAAKPWWEWDPALAQRDHAALQHARAELGLECLFYSYIQWQADTQWRDARFEAAPVGLFGTLPFGVSADSADVWVHQHHFQLDASVGTPADAAGGPVRSWNLPPYRAEVAAADDHPWIRARARRAASLFDGYRVDHLAGFYRTFVIPADGSPPRFRPEAEHDQLQYGEQIAQVFTKPGAFVTADDLGLVPPYVRASLDRLGIPGCRALRWDRHWDAAERPFVDPARYPHMSIATTGTHDMETLGEWWDAAPVSERVLVARIPSVAARSLEPSAPFTPYTRDALLEALTASASSLLVLPIQDVFGWRERINIPSSANGDNWTWALPWPVEDLCDRPDARERARTLCQWMRQYRRSPVKGGRTDVSALVSTTNRGHTGLSFLQPSPSRGRDRIHERYRPD